MNILWAPQRKFQSRKRGLRKCGCLHSVSSWDGTHFSVTLSALKARRHVLHQTLGQGREHDMKRPTPSGSQSSPEFPTPAFLLSQFRAGLTFQRI